MAGGARQAWPLVGRGRELERIEAFLARGESVVIAGPAGVGKTRLAREVADAHAAQGRRVVRLTSSPASASVPYSALATLLPAGKSGVREPEELHRLVVASLTRDGPLILVDDAHQLDPSSAAALRQAVTSGGSVLATMRTGEDAPSDAAVLLGVSERIDIGPLPRPDADRLVRLAIGGAVHPDTLQQLWQAGQGNALFVREMVLGAIDAGLLREQDGVMTLEGHLARVPRLRDLVDARLAELGPTEREALDLLATGEPIGASLLVELTDAAAVESLERKGLAVASIDGARRPVRVSHPLYGEVLRGALPAIATMRHVRSLADAIEARGARRREDVLRVAVWRLEGGGETSPALLVRAGRLAREAGDDVLAARLAGAAQKAGGGVEAALLLSAALGGVGRASDAAAVMDGLPEAARTESELSSTVIRLAEERFWGLGEYDEAEAMLREAALRLSGAPAADVEAQRAVFAMLRGEYDVARNLGAPLLALDDARVVGRASIAVGLALALRGDADGASALAARARANPEAAMEGHVVVHDVAETMALAEAGRISEARVLASARYAEALERPAPLPRAWLPMVLGVVELLAGRLADASEHCETSANGWGDLGLTGPMRWALAGLVLAQAMRGDGPGAQRALDRLDAVPLGQFLMMEPVVARARAWAAQAAGAPADAVRLVEAGFDALDRGAPALAGAVMHDLARLGELEHARGLRARLVRADHWPLQTARVAYVGAVDAADPVLLERAADLFGELGCSLFAAEALAQSASLDRARVQGRSATHATARAHRLLDQVGAAATPPLADLDAPPALTRRERAIADLVIQGLTNREIAEALVVSERTVDNHVQRMFTKLGITRRSDLSRALN